MSNTPLFASDRQVIAAPPANTTVLAYDFAIRDEGSMRVRRMRAGITETLAEGVDYLFPTGVGGPAGGSLQLVMASLAGDTYVLDGLSAAERLSDFLATAAFSSEKINADLDYLTVLAQETRRDLADAAAFPATYEGDRMLPPPSADRVLTGNSEGTRYTSGPRTTEIAAAEGHAEAAQVAAGFAADDRTLAELARDAALSAVPNAFPVTRSAMAELPATVKTAYLKEGDRQGYFTAIEADLSPNVALDPLQGTLVPFASDPTGASGAWVRITKWAPSNVLDFGADITGGVSSVAAFGAAARSAAARVTTFFAYENMPQAPVVEVDVPAGVYMIDWWIDTGNREVTWNLAENAVIIDNTGKRVYQFLEGRIVRKNRVTRPFPHGTLDAAAAFSVAIGGYGDLPAPVNGWTDPANVGTYETMDQVGFAVQNNSVPLLAAKTANFTANTATFTDGPMSAELLRRIRMAEYVEIASGDGYSGSHRGQVLSWAADGTSITVTGWYPIENGAAQLGEVPTDGSAVLFRCFHKLFTLNGIGVLAAEGYASEVAGFENSILNFKAQPTDADVTYGRGWGSDAVNLNPAVRSSSLHVSRGLAYEGFRAAGQEVGFACRGGYQYPDAPVGFEYRGAGVGFVSKNPAEQIVLSTNPGGIEIGNQSVAGSTSIDSHTSGNAAIDFDARILFSGGDGITGGTGTVEFYANLVRTKALRPLLDDSFNLGDAGARWANIHAANGTIVTSDASSKKLRKAGGVITDAEFRAIGRIAPKWFQFKNAIKEKGARNARQHVGYIAQDWAAAWEAEGLDWRKCGAFCEDEIEEPFDIHEEVLVPDMEEYEAEVEDVDDFDGIYIHRGRKKKVTRTRVKTENRELLNEDGSPHMSLQPVLDSDGKPIKDPTDKTGYRRSFQPAMVIHTVLKPKKIVRTEMRKTGKFRMGLRYDECAVMIEAYHRRRIEQLETRLSAIEAKLS